MFWGLIMEPKRRYTQIVKRPFHVSMAALDIFSSNNAPCQVMLNFEERNYLLCTLQKDKTVQCVLDLNFEAGNKVIFATNGDSNVHLTGYLVEDLEDYLEEEDEEVDDEIAVGKKRKTIKVEHQPPKKKSRTEQLLDEADNYDSNDDESFSLSKLGDDSDASASSDEEEDDEMDGEEDEDEDGEDEDEENEESDDGDNDEVSSLSDAEEEKPKSKINGVASKKKQREVQKRGKLIEQKAQSLNVTNKSARGEKTPVKQERSPKAGTVEKANKTPKGEKTPKGDKGDINQKNDSAVKTPKKQQASSPQKRTLEGGIIIQDIIVGDGQVVKPGKLAEVYYEGRLKQNNKVFDKLWQGPAFKFRLGKQEVIKGWDVGVSGMKIGGKRRIVCPPNMAYGPKGSPPQVPPNSTLIFEVVLKNIK